MLFAPFPGQFNLAPPFLKPLCPLIIQVTDAPRTGNTFPIVW
jgi:hypothetical protein